MIHNRDTFLAKTPSSSRTTVLSMAGDNNLAVRKGLRTLLPLKYLVFDRVELRFEVQRPLVAQVEMVPVRTSGLTLWNLNRVIRQLHKLVKSFNSWLHRLKL